MGVVLEEEDEYAKRVWSQGKTFYDAELIKDAAAGELCNDRNVSKGYVNPKLEFRDTKTKGYGIFAKEDISSGEFLAEYAGELIVVWKEGNLASIKGTQ
ncbi:hypothetical protein L3Y34_011192 [Caenorhabditis briggsae]|uniref:SET domain-containing protein n=1 Tax=Caenorhabditis briggsae TaxID=6238 RepID=A0AAE8ZPA9_CAEBR|nr:hypothetical protein L3Y34_011192 [Caenorhabditis briggsae]